MRAVRESLCLLVLSLGLALPAAADVVHLVEGGALEGQVVGEDREGLVVRTAAGTTIVVPRAQVREVERGATVDELYRARLRRTDPRDGEARYALGLWLKSLRRPDLARREFLAVLLLDPEHRFARSELGQVRRAGEWIAVEAAQAGFAGALAQSGSQVDRALPGADVREVLTFHLGCSPELAAALVDARGRDRARAKTARALLQGDQEPERLLASLRAGGTAGALAWDAILRARQLGGGCHAILAPAQLDPATLERLVREHVQASLQPALTSLVPDLLR